MYGDDKSNGLNKMLEVQYCVGFLLQPWRVGLYVASGVRNRSSVLAVAERITPGETRREPTSHNHLGEFRAAQAAVAAEPGDFGPAGTRNHLRVN